MSSKSADARSRAVSLFWHKYLSVLEKASVPENSRPYYRKAVESYIAAHRGRKLASHGQVDVTRYLIAKGRNPRLSSRHFRQIVDALMFLYRDTIRAGWAKQFDWQHWQTFGRTLPRDHASLMREAPAGHLSAPSANELIQKFRAHAGGAYARFVKTLRLRDMAVRTEQTYEHWLARFFNFHGWPMVDRVEASDVAVFLEHLAINRRVSSSTQRIALNALIFFFRETLGRSFEDAAPYTRAPAKRRLPVVLTQGEVRRLLKKLEGPTRLMAALMYGTGMRLMECVRLRVQDVDFGFKQITVRNGKGGKDRVVPLPERLVSTLRRHLASIKTLHDDDLAAGFGEAFLPSALARKFGSAAYDWRWQYVFPSARLSVDPGSQKTRRHHIHETGLQKAIRNAAREAAIDKRVTSHTMRHSFATHLLQQGKDIRVIQDLLGHADVSTTMIYTHVLKKGGLGVQSPLDFL